MSELKEALAAILHVNFREPIAASDQCRIAEFLERTAQELAARDARISEREQVVSQRESNVQVREDNVGQQVKTLAAIGRLREVTRVPKPAFSWSMRKRV